MNIWRIHLKPGGKNTQNGIDPRKLCLDNGFVGVGWQIDYEKGPIEWNFYEKRATKRYYDKGDNSWWPALKAIKIKMEINDLIWTRDLQGIYHLGRITGDWYYNTSKKCEKADLVNVRPCEWLKVGTIGAVPGKVVNSFRARRTVQKVNGSSINMYSQYIFNEHSGSEIYSLDSGSGSNIFNLMSSEDLEDVIGIYLQFKEGYMIVPSSSKMDTMHYEYQLINRSKGKRAVVQVKNGHDPLNRDNYADIEDTVYLFTSQGEYTGRKRPNIICLESAEIENFLFSNKKMMPRTVQKWMDIYAHLNK